MLLTITGESWRFPLDWSTWAACLESHPDQEFAAYVVQGLKDGFRIGFDYANRTVKKASRNMASALDHPEVVRQYLARECSEGRVLGPLDPDQFPTTHVSRFGVIPKRTTGQWRLIVDLSSPEGGSVNDGIEEVICSLSYVSIDDAVRAIREKGRGAMLAKVDIRSAYRIVPVHPEDRWLLGMLWEGALYVDTALPFGLRSTPKIFTAVADAAEWIAKQQGVAGLFHYLDDFLIVAPPDLDEGAAQLTILLALFDHLNIPVAPEKLEGPATSIVFLGIELDTIQLRLRLPVGKLQELQKLIQSWIGRRSCYKQELQSLAGKLQHACKVVSPGRTFLRRVFEMLRIGCKKHHHIRLSAAFRSDLMWWHIFLARWNGISIIPGVNDTRPPIEIFTDASGGVGCGAWWCPQWIQLKWAPGMKFGELPITQKEVLPVVLACAVWGKQWSGSAVMVHCDNEAAVSVLNSGYSRDPNIMHLLRCLFFIKASYHLSLRVVHIPGKQNVVADAISRNLLSTLSVQVPAPLPSPSPIPKQLMELLVEVQPDWTSVDWAQLFGSCFQRDLLPPR